MDEARTWIWICVEDLFLDVGKAFLVTYALAGGWHPSSAGTESLWCYPESEQLNYYQMSGQSSQFFLNRNTCMQPIESVTSRSVFLRETVGDQRRIWPHFEPNKLLEINSRHICFGSKRLGSLPFNAIHIVCMGNSRWKKVLPTILLTHVSVEQPCLLHCMLIG